MSSTSGQKFHNNKKPQKKYQQCKRSEENDNTPGKSVLQTGTTERKPEFVDLKDFPELKISGRQNKNSIFESKTSSSRFKPWSSFVGNEKKSNAAFPALVSTENLKRNEISPKDDNNTAQAVSENNVTEISEKSDKAGIERQSKANSKESKPALQKPAIQPKRNPNKKKRSDPVFINFQDILSTSRIQKKAEKRQPKTLRSKVERLKNKEVLSGNFLDSSNPKRNRGKHREIRKKKLSKLKLTIIKERIIKSKIKENAIAAQFGSGTINLIDKIDFNTEIKIYLNKTNEKKFKNLEIKVKKSKSNENINTEIINKVKQECVETELVEPKEESLKKLPPVKGKVIPHITAEGGVKYTSKFREYCDNIITPDLNTTVSKLIEELIKLQDRLFLRDPIKAKAKKRHVSGIREVRKYLSLKKVKMIIIVPNLEKLQMEGSLYDSINDLKSMADEQKVPYGFALDRYKLGRCTKKNVPVSAFAVLSYEGLEDLFESVLKELLEAKRKFSELSKPAVAENEDNVDNVNSKVLSTLVSAFEEVLQISKEVQSDVS